MEEGRRKKVEGRKQNFELGTWNLKPETEESSRRQKQKTEDREKN
jgi:hypothetical protein